MDPSDPVFDALVGVRKSWEIPDGLFRLAKCVQESFRKAGLPDPTATVDLLSLLSGIHEFLVQEAARGMPPCAPPVQDEKKKGGRPRRLPQICG